VPGKDVVGWNLIIRAALKKVGVYFYCAPTYSQGRKIIWDSITNEGFKFLDYIPPELIERKNDQQMKIHLINGSMIQIIGSDSYDKSLVGSNPQGIVFTEWALSDPRAYQYARPILTANNGWALMISTPRGKNALWELYEIARQSRDWFCYRLTVDDTQHISRHQIDKERADGVMSEDLIQQEYYTSFDLGVEGSYYLKYIDRMRLKGQIGMVPWEPAFKVHTVWDIGVRDSTAIIFFQTIGQTVRIIDCYEKSKEGLEHYVQVLGNKPYQYGSHIGPHDIRVKEFSTGYTRWEKARQLGITFTICPQLSIMDGIEAVRSTLPKCWIDEKACIPLLKALENYRQEYDAKRKVYKNNPLHDNNSHFADSFRYLALSLPKTRDGLTADELDRRYAQAVYGNQGNLPPMFRDDKPY
jgi:phage terminase large subunit